MFTCLLENGPSNHPPTARLVVLKTSTALQCDDQPTTSDMILLLAVLQIANTRKLQQSDMPEIYALYGTFTFASHSLTADKVESQVRIIVLSFFMQQLSAAVIEVSRKWHAQLKSCGCSLEYNQMKQMNTNYDVAKLVCRVIGTIGVLETFIILMRNCFARRYVMQHRTGILIFSIRSAFIFTALKTEEGNHDNDMDILNDAAKEGCLLYVPLTSQAFHYLTSRLPIRRHCFVDAIPVNFLLAHPCIISETVFKHVYLKTSSGLNPVNHLFSKIDWMATNLVIWNKPLSQHSVIGLGWDKSPVRQKTSKKLNHGKTAQGAPSYYLLLIHLLKPIPNYFCKKCSISQYEFTNAINFLKSVLTDSTYAEKVDTDEERYGREHKKHTAIIADRKYLSQICAAHANFSNGYGDYPHQVTGYFCGNSGEKSVASFKWKAYVLRRILNTTYRLCVLTYFFSRGNAGIKGDDVEYFTSNN
ncbi:hypothetical protein EGR_09820 [Echinococcus granulosus]|uniref:Uncharacterized protein n=1 Tax=Echinococcus granulosus TaxID=6210 RepID=W6U2I5_ECHGR|nr:hypothetical protein EGR_09820 [Echinococcus granulosus]EUB55325.1 hypothetical protein EGR_09820 [Echinococcus granulosus]